MKRFLTGLALFIVAAQACALVALPVTNNAHVTVPIAVNNLTRIAVMGGRISQAIGLYTGGHKHNPLYTLRSDADTGNIFIAPESKKPFTLTLRTEHNDYYTVTFKPTTMRPDTVMLVPQFYRANVLQQQPVALPYETAIIGLMHTMVSGGVSPDYAVSNIAVKAKPFNDLGTLRPVRIYQGAEYTGTIWQFTNTSHVIALLNVRLFRQKGTMAVAMAAKRVLPKQSTWIYTVKGSANG